MRQLFYIVILIAIASCVACGRDEATRRDASLLLKEGKAAFNQGDLLSAYSKLQKVRDASNQSGDTCSHFESTVYLCLLYQMIGQDDESYSLLKTIQYIDIPDSQTYCSLYYLRLRSFFSMTRDKDYNRAKQYARQCIDFVEQKHPGDTALLYMDMANLAELYFLAHDYKQAEQLTTTLMQSRQPQFKMYLSELYYCMALLSYHQHAYDSAYHHLERGLIESRKYEAYDNEKNILSMLCRLDSARGHLDAYISHKQEADHLREKLEGNEIYYKVAMLQGQHKIDLMRLESEKSRAINLLSVALLTVALVAATTIFALIYKSTKSKQQNALLAKQKLANMIEMERMEKELLMLKMEKRGELLDQAYKENIAMTLKLAEQGPTPEDTKTTLERQLKSTEDLLKQKLWRDYPSLTNNDIRILSLMKLKTDADIMASVLNITAESLAKAKYRLRKKLKLNTAEELETFINSMV